MRRIVLDMKGGLLAEAVMQSLSGCDPDFLVYRSSKPEETLALCRSCRANVLVMEVIRQGIWKLSERLRLCSAVRQFSWVCKVLLLVDENADELLASEVRQAGIPLASTPLKNNSFNCSLWVEPIVFIRRGRDPL